MSARHRGLLAPLLLIVALALMLVACGGASTPQGEPAQKASVHEPYKGFEARPSSELDDYIEKAIELGKKRQDAVDEDADEGKLAKTANADFSAANNYYRSGEYEMAQESYEGALDGYALHLGANVNLTLALMQQEKDDEALVQAFACIYLFPKEYGCLLNAQAAGTACEFGEGDIENAIGYVSIKATASKPSEGFEKEEFLYNALWNDIEVQLHGIEPGVFDDDSKEVATYNELMARAEPGATISGDDEDGQALQAYLEAAGIELGLMEKPAEEQEKAESEDSKAEAEAEQEKTDEAKESEEDKSKEKADTKADEKDDKSKKADEDSAGDSETYEYDNADTIFKDPKPIIDDENCTLTLVSLTYGKNKPQFVWYEVTNNSKKTLRVVTLDDWEVEGKKVTARVGLDDEEYLEIEPDAVYTDHIRFSDGKTDYLEGELESFSGSIAVMDGDKTLTTYKMTYEKP